MGGMDLGFGGDVVVHRSSIADENWVDRPADIPSFVHLKPTDFEVVFQNDILKIAKDLADANGWSHSYYLQDIRTLHEEISLPKADVVIGGFPCQDFSHAGKRKGLDSQRGTLYTFFVKVVKEVQPAVFVAENVKGLLTMKGVIETIRADFESAGYTVEFELIKCEEYGIPQTRHRVIIFGVRNDLIAGRTPGWNKLVENRIECPISHYFEHLEEPQVSPDIAQRLYSKARRLDKGQGQSIINERGFAPTIRAEHHGNIEFRNQAWRLSLREAALIQTFPPRCILTVGNKPSCIAYKPIGNAVPPLLGYLIARKVKSLLS